MEGILSKSKKVIQQYSHEYNLNNWKILKKLKLSGLSFLMSNLMINVRRSKATNSIPKISGQVLFQF